VKPWRQPPPKKKPRRQPPPKKKPDGMMEKMEKIEL
jgi:hypothetical protein